MKKCFLIFNLATLNPHEFKLLVKILLAEIFESVNWLILSAEISEKMTLRMVKRLKNSDFILESKMAELNKNKNSKYPVRPDGV